MSELHADIIVGVIMKNELIQALIKTAAEYPLILDYFERLFLTQIRVGLVVSITCAAAAIVLFIIGLSVYCNRKTSTDKIYSIFYYAGSVPGLASLLGFLLVYYERQQLVDDKIRYILEHLL